MFDRLRTRIDSHFASSPLVKQRAAFMTVTHTTPIDRKVKFTPEVVGAAAAYEAFRAFERHDSHTSGTKVKHIKGKDIITGLASAMAIKMIDEKQLPFTSKANEEKFKFDAQRFARADAKRALRESGFYGNHELDPWDDDEKLAPKRI